MSNSPPSLVEQKAQQVVAWLEKIMIKYWLLSWTFCIVFSYGFFVCLFVFHWGGGGKFKLLYSYFWNAVSFYLLSFPVLCVLPSVLHPVSLFMDLLHLPLLPQLFPFSLITLKCIHSPALPFNPLSECLFTFCCVCALCLLWDLCPLVLSA